MKRCRNVVFFETEFTLHNTLPQPTLNSDKDQVEIVVVSNSKNDYVEDKTLSIEKQSVPEINKEDHIDKYQGRKFGGVRLICTLV